MARPAIVKVSQANAPTFDANTYERISQAMLSYTVIEEREAGSNIQLTNNADDQIRYFINLKDGDTVSSPFLVQFGLSGMGVAPAGVEKPNTGHHHLLIDTTLTADQMKEPIPADDNHKHFGGGQTEAMVTLPKGQHTLQLVLGDWTHIPHVPPVMSEPIRITVR